MILLVGLGNPGKQYENTRHNMGRLLVTQWAREYSSTFSSHKNFQALITAPFAPSQDNKPIISSLLGKRINKGVNEKTSLMKQAEGGSSKVICLLPETFMNLSGEAVQKTARFYKIPDTNIWIVMDDLNLDFGIIRTRQFGSDGGHNGLKSIIEKMGTDHIPRVRVGIGYNAKIPAEEYVLQKFTDNELHLIQSDMYSKFSSIISRALTATFPTDTVT